MWLGQFKLIPPLENQLKTPVNWEESIFSCKQKYYFYYMPYREILKHYILYNFIT